MYLKKALKWAKEAAKGKMPEEIAKRLNEE